jgi:hypothetical protein
MRKYILHNLTFNKYNSTTTTTTTTTTLDGTEGEEML